MSIEKDLQQKKPFKTDMQRAVVNLLFTSRFVESKLKSEYKAFGITLKQYNILRILNGAGKAISTQLIGERMIDRMSDISRIVDRMLDKKIVTKCVNTHDKRLVDVQISEDGKKMLEKINEKNDFQEMSLGNLNEEDAKLLNTLLDKVRGYN